jgi:hypothetical protein
MRHEHGGRRVALDDVGFKIGWKNRAGLEQVRNRVNGPKVNTRCILSYASDASAVRMVVPKRNT